MFDFFVTADMLEQPESNYSGFPVFIDRDVTLARHVLVRNAKWSGEGTVRIPKDSMVSGCLFYDCEITIIAEHYYCFDHNVIYGESTYQAIRNN